MSEHCLPLDVQKVAQDVQNIRHRIEKGDKDNAIKYLDHLSLLMDKAITQEALARHERKQLDWHELSDLKHDLCELNIELMRLKDRVALTQNAVGLMIEQIDDITIRRDK